MSEVSDMMAETWSALEDAGSGHGRPLVIVPGDLQVTGVVQPIPTPEFEGRTGADAGTMVTVSISRDQLEGVSLLAGGSIQDDFSEVTYRIVYVEDLPPRPFVVCTCQASATV